MSLSQRRLSWAALYQVPLGASSFLLFLLTKSFLQQLANEFHRRRPEHQNQWQFLSAEFMAKKGALPVYLTTAPRWNPHATIATAGPVRVEREFCLDLEPPARSAAEWFFVFYTYPERKTAGVISSFSNDGLGSARFQVPNPGQYLIGVRYYRAKDPAEFPAIRVDGKDWIAARCPSTRVNSFYERLHERSNPFYYCLAYHLYPMLRYKLLPSSWMERIFLPVGNPETIFRYGVVEKGQRLDCRMHPERFESYSLYVTVYNMCSLPTAWYEVSPSNQGPGPILKNRGFYLVRLQPRISNPPVLDSAEESELVRVINPAEAAGPCQPELV